MIQAAADPSVEVVLFGRSVGEALLVRLGERYWVAIDSMLIGREAVALRYLRQRDVDPTDIKVAVATHWHTDHVQGLDQILTASPNARFLYPNVHTPAELKLLAAAGEVLGSRTRPSPGQAFAASLRALGPRAARPIGACAPIASHGGVRLVALSPTDYAVRDGLTRVGAVLAQTRKGRSVPKPKPNATSVAACLFTPRHTAILGADLIDHGKYGWGQAVRETEEERNPRRGRLLKVPHHGSKGADAKAIWASLMDRSSVGCLAPYSPSGLPGSRDLERLEGNGCVPHVAATTQPMGATEALLAGLGPDVKVDAGLTVYLRCRPRGPHWHVTASLL